MKKSLFCTLCILASFMYACAQNTFVVKGELSGANLDGMAWLMDGTTTLDSAAMKQGRFELRTELKSPRLLTVTVKGTTNPTEPQSPADNANPVSAAIAAALASRISPAKAIPLLADRGKVTIKAVIEDIPAIPTGGTVKSYYDYSKIESITGLSLHQTYEKCMRAIGQIAKERSTIFYDEYITHLNPKQGETRKLSDGIEIVTRIDQKDELIREQIRKFIASNTDNLASAVIIENDLNLFTVAEIDRLISLLSPRVLASDLGRQMLETAATIKPTLSGAPYVDLTLLDREGNSVKLSDHAGKGKYVLLEFWASWCNPCRADIPHLKEVYNLYNADGFEIISISMNDNESHWTRAMDEEQMPWLQISDLKGIPSDVSRTYNFNGVPACVLLGPDGTIVSRNFRGRWMDRELIKMYGNKFGDKY